MVSDSVDPSSAQTSEEAELPVSLQLHDDLLEALDLWIATRPEPRPSRAGAIRYILAAGLVARTEREADSSS